METALFVLLCFMFFFLCVAAAAGVYQCYLLYYLYFATKSMAESINAMHQIAYNNEVEKQKFYEEMRNGDAEYESLNHPFDEHEEEEDEDEDDVLFDVDSEGETKKKKKEWKH